MPKPIAEALDTLRGSFGGSLLRSGDPGYEDARKVHNGMVDKRPAVVARCRGVADIVDAIRFARDTGLQVAVRGGGHNVAGRATINDGLVIDLSPMKGIHVDPKAGVVRAQGGVTWGEYNRETQLHGLATTGGVVASTGIAGLTLGGGLGWLMGKHGLAIDNLLSVEVVTAAGQVLTASADEHADLFWALRGGGGNFGVAASLTYRAVPVGPMITGGLLAHSFPNARDMLRCYRDATAASPDELTVFAALLHGPDGSKMSGMIACHCGTLPDGEAATGRIKSFGTPVMDALGPMPYSALNSMLDDGYPRGALNYWKSSFLGALTDDVIDALIARYQDCPSPMTQIVIEHMHGAAARIGATDTAFPHRTEGYNLLVLGQWMDPADSARCTAWVKDTYEAMQPFMAHGRYVNYLAEDETDAGGSAYGPNHARLRRIKTQYDPDNFFRMNQNIEPA